MCHSSSIIWEKVVVVEKVINLVFPLSLWFLSRGFLDRKSAIGLFSLLAGEKLQILTFFDRNTWVWGKDLEKILALRKGSTHTYVTYVWDNTPLVEKLSNYLRSLFSTLAWQAPFKPLSRVKKDCCTERGKSNRRIFFRLLMGNSGRREQGPLSEELFFFLLFSPRHRHRKRGR